MTSTRSAVTGGIVTVIAAAALVAGPASAAGGTAVAARATATAKARKAFAVLRRPKARRDVMRLHVGSKRRRARAAALNSRLVYDGGADVRVYLVLDGTRLCLSWVSDNDGYAGGGCQSATAVADGTALLYGSVLKPGSARVAAAVRDGSTSAQLVPEIGPSLDLRIANNAVYRELSAPGHLSWTGPDGKVNRTADVAPG